MTLVRLTGLDGRLVLVNVAHILWAQPAGGEHTRVQFTEGSTLDVQETSIEIQEQAWEQLQVVDEETR